MENLVGNAKTDLMIPKAPFGDLAAANAAAAAWCAEVNGAVHCEICAVPAERLVTERPAVLAAGSDRQPVTRKVDRLSCVRFGSARYSVPVRAGRAAALTTGGCWSPWSAPGRSPPSTPSSRPVRRRSMRSTTGGPRPAPRRAVRPKTTTEKEFCGLGPVAGAFLAALGRAVAFSRWHAADVRSILAAGPGTASPRRRRARPGPARCPGPAAGRLRPPRAVMSVAAPPPLASDLAAGLQLKLAARRPLPPPPRVADHGEDPAVGTRGACCALNKEMFTLSGR